MRLLAAVSVATSLVGGLGRQAQSDQAPVPTAIAGPGPSREGGRTSAPLAGPWWFRQVDDKVPADWLPATVPGCVHTDLLAAGRIPDPFVGTNERDLQWIEKADWEYRTVVAADAALLARDRVELVWQGLDTIAEVFVNGVSVLSAHNMFRTWRVDIKPRLHPGDNTVLVRFRSPIAHARPAFDRLGYQLPAVNDQGTPMLSMFTRKAPYHYGWDWGPRLVTSGIWRPVLLQSWDGARLDDVQVVQDHLEDTRADVTVNVAVQALAAASGAVDVSIDGTVVGTVQARLQAGGNRLAVKVAILRPQRWWPNGLGPAHLYSVRVALAVDGIARDVATTRIGLRTVEVVHRRDREGKSFTIKVNGAPVFMKGANYIPPDSFLSRVTPAHREALVRAAAAANMNMLRVWGGGVYEDDQFYELCDQLGILVWQDFMFACSLYPGDAAFVDDVRQEAIQNVRRLRNHPSLALWAGNNEIEAAWAQWGWPQKFHLNAATQAKLTADYRHLFHQVLPDVVAREDPGRFYTRSSPSANDDGVAPNKLGWGDMHYWGVWHAQEPYTKYADNVSRFMSEYGFQSFPELSTVARYATADQQQIDSPVMRAHQRHPRGNQLIRAYMLRDFRPPRDFASFLYVSQVLQATVIKFGAEAHRRRMPSNAGSLYWQLDDCWPVASWSSIDHFGRWKALHHYARRFFAPVLVSPVMERGAVNIHVVSDRREDLQAHLTLRLIDFDGRELWRKDSDLVLAANTSRVYQTLPRRTVLAQADPARVVLVADLAQGDHLLSRNLLYFARARDQELPAPDLTTSVEVRDGVPVVKVTAGRLARDVRLTVDGADGEFTDNFFDVLPGQTISVAWRATSPTTLLTEAAFARALHVISLRDAF